MTPLQALQRTLAGEHAAVYVLGVLGGRVSASARPDLASRLTSSYATHRGRRDQLTAMVRARGAVPVAAQVSYRLPNAAATADQLTAAALTVERALRGGLRGGGREHVAGGPALGGGRADRRRGQ